MKAVVLGLGVSGIAAGEFLQRRGYEVVGVDQNPKGVLSFPTATDYKTPCDLLVLSPGIPLTHPICRLAKEVIGEAELACRFMKQKALAITGTNGKTTVTSLVAHVLNSSGVPALAAGNIGLPLTAAVDTYPNYLLVVELSSYQLETLSSQVFDGGAILNITPDHLDRYKTMEPYAAAKCRLFHCLKPEAPLFIEEKTLKQWAALCDPKKAVSYSGANFEEENTQAAYLLCQLFGLTKDLFFAALKSFQKPAHRMEFVSEIEGISYYNDSKGTNIDATVRAVESIACPIHLIAGGVDKGASYAPWVSAFKNKVAAVYTIGQASEKIHADLGENYPIHACESLQIAFNKATLSASKGEAVLLSPGCSSFDMFKNYEERGNCFKQLVFEKGEAE